MKKVVFSLMLLCGMCSISFGMDDADKTCLRLAYRAQTRVVEKRYPAPTMICSPVDQSIVCPLVSDASLLAQEKSKELARTMDTIIPRMRKHCNLFKDTLKLYNTFLNRPDFLWDGKPENLFYFVVNDLKYHVHFLPKDACASELLVTESDRDYHEKRKRVKKNWVASYYGLLLLRHKLLEKDQAYIKESLARLRKETNSNLETSKKTLSLSCTIEEYVSAVQPFDKNQHNNFWVPRVHREPQVMVCPIKASAICPSGLEEQKFKDRVQKTETILQMFKESNTLFADSYELILHGVLSSLQKNSKGGGSLVDVCKYLEKCERDLVERDKQLSEATSRHRSGYIWKPKDKLDVKAEKLAAWDSTIKAHRAVLKKLITANFALNVLRADSPAHFEENDKHYTT